MSLYKTLKTVGLATALTLGMVASAAVGHFYGKGSDQNAGYLRGHAAGKVEGENGIVNTIEKYSPGTVEKVMSEMEDEIERAEFENTIDQWLDIEPSKPEDFGINPDFEGWLKELSKPPAPKKKKPSTPEIRYRQGYKPTV